jgi:hypothetical protein
VADDIEQLFPGFRACVLAEIGKWREYDPKVNSGILDSFSSVIAGHRDRYPKASLLRIQSSLCYSRPRLLDLRCV